MKKNFIVKKFNDLRIFDINIDKLRGKNFYKNSLFNRDFYYKKYKKYLNKSPNTSHLCKNNKNKIFISYKKYQLRKCLNCGVIFNNLNIKKFKIILCNFQN